MRKIKRITSIILAALMIVSLFVAVPMSASAVTRNDISVLLRQMEDLADKRYEQGDYDATDALYMSSTALDHQFSDSGLNANDPNVERAYNIASAVYNHFNGTGSVNVTSVSRIEVDKLSDALVDLMYDLMSDDRYSARVLDCAEDILQEAYHAADGNSEDQNLLSAYSLASFILAQYTGTTGSYTVTWKNGDTTLETDTDVAADSTPTYNGTTPTKASDTYYDYTFSGWSDDSNTYAADALPAVSGDVTYTAQFTATAKPFKVYVKKLTGGTYTIENLTGGTTVAQLKEIIADQIDIPATAQRLVFAGMTIEDAKTLAEYNIQKESTIHLVIRSYTVTWLNYDNSELGTTAVQYGSTPTYDGTPERPEDANNTYTFAAWDNGTTTYVLGVDDLPPVTGDVTYTAVFTANPKHTVHTYTANPTFNWTQDDSTGDWNCDKLTLTCTGCDATQDYEVAGFFGASAVTCTANTDGSFTYSVSKKVDGTTYSDTKTYEADHAIASTTQLKAAAKKGGSWELGSDIDQAVGISCADGFVLDGKNHTVTRHANVATNPVFVAANKNAGFTLKNLTIDGIANQTEVRPAIASAQTSGNAGNVINLENVKIVNWDFDQTNNGAVLAWGNATVNMKNCDVDTDSDYDVWGGAASTVNIDGGKAGTVYLNGGTSSATVDNGAAVTVETSKPESVTIAPGYALNDNGDGTYTVVIDNSSPLNPIEKAAADINDGNLFGINCDYLQGTLLGVQKKIVAGEETSSQESAKNMRFVAVLDTDLVQGADDYGFVLAKVTDTTTKTFGYDNTNFDNLKANMGNGEKTISAKGTYNNVCGNEAYGDPSDTNTDYKYITCAVNNVDDSSKIVARFYYKKDGKTYYAKYAGHNYQYTGCIAAWSDLP